MKHRFFNGWLIFTLVILLAATAGAYNTISDPTLGYTWIDAWPLSIGYLTALGTRSYQYFIQKR